MHIIGSSCARSRRSCPGSMTTYEKLPAKEANIEAGLPPPYEEAVGAEESEDPLGLRGRCFLPRVLFCLSLPTAVWALAVLDVFHGIGALASAALLLVVKAEEPAVDAVYARYVGGLASNSTVVTPFFPTTFHGNMTNALTLLDSKAWEALSLSSRRACCKTVFASVWQASYRAATSLHQSL